MRRQGLLCRYLRRRHAAADLPPEMYDGTFRMLDSLVAPRHQWLDAQRYAAHTDAVEALGLLTVASAHGPVLTGAAIPDAFDRVRAMAGAPILPPPGRALLDQLLGDGIVAVGQ